MPITITLDAPALERLLADQGPEVQLALHDAIVQQIARNALSTVLPAGLIGAVRNEALRALQDAVADDEALRQAMNKEVSSRIRSIRDNRGGWSKRLTPEATHTIQVTVDALFSEAISARVSKRVEELNDRLMKRLEERVRELEVRLDGIIDQKLGPAFEHTVADMVRKRLTAVAAAIGEA